MQEADAPVLVEGTSCPWCAAQTADGDPICSKCGSSLGASRGSASRHPSRRLIPRLAGVACIVGLLAIAGLLNPWNLTLVDVLLNHPFFAAAVVSLVALITVVTGNKRPEARTMPLTWFAWLAVLLACSAIGLGAAGTASFFARSGSWLDSMGIGIAVAAAVLATVGLGSIRRHRHRLRWPGAIAVVPLALVFAVAVVVTPFDVASQIWYEHLDFEQVDGLRLDWVTTGGMSECSNNQFWLKNGSGVFERKLLVDSDHCGDRVTVRAGGVVTVGCLKKFIVDTNTLKVISEEELHEPDCT